MIAVPPVVTVAAGALTWFLGIILVKKVSFFSKYNLPPPVIGGFFVALIFAFLHYQQIEVLKFDNQLVPSLMIGFFTSLGFGASIRDLKAGGRAVFIFLLACSVLLIVQVLIGAIISPMLGKPPLFGVLTSAVSLVGGPATALSFAGDFEAAGVNGAASAGLAAAMLGIILGGLLGSPISTILIERNNLKSNVSRERNPENSAEVTTSVPISSLAPDLIYHLAWILIIGSLGWYLSGVLKSIGIKLPFYIGSMIVASIVRNFEDVTGILKLKVDWIEAIGTACLILFISVSMMTLELWTVIDVAGPLFINLAIQAILVSIVAITIMFRISGRDYEAAVMSGGMIGFMLGATANALATMTSITNRYGPAPKAFLVVPLVGACFIDFINAIVIAIALNF